MCGHDLNVARRVGYGDVKSGNDGGGKSSDGGIGGDKNSSGGGVGGGAGGAGGTERLFLKGRERRPGGYCC